MIQILVVYNVSILFLLQKILHASPAGILNDDLNTCNWDPRSLKTIKLRLFRQATSLQRIMEDIPSVSNWIHCNNIDKNDTIQNITFLIYYLPVIDGVISLWMALEMGNWGKKKRL